MSRPWFLVLTRPKGDPKLRVGGLPIALRLALDAQRVGAAGVALGSDSGLTALADPRLRIPIVSSDAGLPEGVRTVRVGASVVVHRETIRVLSSASGASDAELVTESPPSIDTPYAFEPVDVVDGASAARAERALFRSLRKPQDGWTSRWLNRYISLTISRWLVKTPLLPNQVSVGILAVGLYGAWLASRGTYWTMLAGAALFQAQSILDGCDGEMSRISHRGSHLGEWLDTIGDDLTNYGFFAGTAIGLHRMTGNGLYLVCGAVTVGCGLTASLIEYRYLLKIGSGDLLKYPTSQTAEGSGFFAAIAPLFKRDTFVFLTLLSAAANLLGPMLVVFSIAAVGILANVFAAEARMAKERRAASPSPPA